MNKLFIISGMSGSGKTSIMRNIMGNESEIVSLTTRKKRDGEIEGEDYYFIDEATFSKMENRGQLAEKTTYYGRSNYGVSKKEIESKLNKGNAFIVVDYNGFKQLKKHYPESISIFLYSSKVTCSYNMYKRGDTHDKVFDRLSTYDEEFENKSHYDYFIKNIRGNMLKTMKIISTIIEAETIGEDNDFA